MSNSLERLKNDLRRLAKRCKNIKYTEGLLLAFLMTGLLTFSQMGVTSPEIKEARQSIDTSISDMKKLFKEAKQENNKLLKQSNLELIQLMEQGDHVVKSPWSSWQFGGNYYYSDWQGTYKGRGDKAEKYPYEGVFTRYAAGTAEEMNRYIGKIYPYMAAADMVYSMEKLADIIKENNYVSYDEVNNNFRNTYRHNTVKSYVLRSYNSSVNHHSATSDSGGGSSSHSSGGSSGGGHGGGGGGSW